MAVFKEMALRYPWQLFQMSHGAYAGEPVWHHGPPVRRKTAHLDQVCSATYQVVGMEFQRMALTTSRVEVAAVLQHVMGCVPDGVRHLLVSA